MFDALGVEARTGWRVVARRVVASTNDAAAALVDAGPADRTVVVADRQTSGRGRGGSRFASPPGGLYASLVVRVRPADLPASLVAAVAVALAEAIESAALVPAHVKWPNDLWVAGQKAGGILVEAVEAGDNGDALPAGTVPVVVGVGVNLRGVPAGLPPEVAQRTTALDLHAKAPVSREALLLEFLPRVDRRLLSLAERKGRAAVERDFRARMALVNERVRCLVGEAPRKGVLRDVSLRRGLLIEARGGERTWLPMAHVRELRHDRP